jgi:ubiquinone/menaquinone biosynthesis C-methylase UbiE
MQGAPYVLGHSHQELARLRVQARLLEPVTRALLREAGISSGMRVLDIGSGAGDVAFLAAELVGAAGSVLGTDRAAAAVEAASANARGLGLSNVSFRQGDPAGMDFAHPFDAVIGRYVLLYQANPAAMLGALARRAQPGGILAFHEPDWLGARSEPAAPTYDRCCLRLQEAFRRSGTDTNMAARLYTSFVRAGLRPPAMQMRTHIGGAGAIDDFLDSIAGLSATLLPAMERLGVATADEIGIATLAERMKSEVRANGSLIVGRAEVTAWTRT